MISQNSFPGTINADDTQTIFFCLVISIPEQDHLLSLQKKTSLLPSRYRLLARLAPFTGTLRRPRSLARSCHARPRGSGSGTGRAPLAFP